MHGLRWSIDRYGYQGITNSCSADDSVHPEISTVARDIADPRIAERIATETGPIVMLIRNTCVVGQIHAAATDPSLMRW